MAKSGEHDRPHARVRLRGCLAIGALARLGLDRPVDGEVRAVGLECDVDPAQRKDLADRRSGSQHQVDDVRHVAGRLGPWSLLRRPRTESLADRVEVLEGQGPGFGLLPVDARGRLDGFTVSAS